MVMMKTGLSLRVLMTMARPHFIAGTMAVHRILIMFDMLHVT